MKWEKLLSPLHHESPLAQRGWVLQERLLSHRVLYFTEWRMVLECNECWHFESEARPCAERPAQPHKELEKSHFVRHLGAEPGHLVRAR